MIIKTIKNILKDKTIDWSYTEDLQTLSLELESRGEINFCLEEKSGGSDYWLQAEYYSKKLKKTIVWDHSFQDSFEGVDEFAETVMRTSSEICEFEKRITLAIE